MHKHPRIPSLFLRLILVLTCPAALAAAQPSSESLKPGRPSVFLDAPDFDAAALRADIGFVDWLDSAGGEDVLVSIRGRIKESGDSEYTLRFEGRNAFRGENQTLTAPTEAGASPEQVRQVLVHTLKLGLMRYAGKTAVADRLSLTFKDKVKPTAVEDKWNFWVFNMNVNTFLSGERTYKTAYFSANASASRVTPGWKLHFRLNGSSTKDSFDYEDSRIESSSNSGSFTGLAVKSLNDHFSVGGFLQTSTSTFNNIDYRINPAPAVEYDLFPYSQCTKRQLRFLYRLNFILVRYREETIYEKTRENLWSQSLSVTLELKEKWGTISAALEGAHFLHDIGKNRLNLYGEITVRLFRGLNFELSGGGSRIRDQLSLPRGGATLEEVLLRRQQLATTFDYYFSVGLSYSFGSTQSRVVNPRFGAGSQRISISL